MPAPDDPVVNVRAATIRYGRREVLGDVSFEVPRGAVFALLGRNGAGKSSLVRCLLGLQRPSAGLVRVFGLDPWRERPRALARTGVVPETPDAPSDLRVSELVRFCGRLHARWDAGRVLRLCDRFEVSPAQKMGQLSRGQKTAVMAALALGHDPDLLVLDDPTLGLDAVSRGTLVAELVDAMVERDLTLVVATHDLAWVEGLATHVGILHGGRLLAAGQLEAMKVARGASLEELFAMATSGEECAA
jgi:ABC-2 type transport system ATP-binding protein